MPTDASPSDEACYRCGSTARAAVDDRNAVVAWMVLALTMRNPYAIAVNLKSRWAPPRNARECGAVTLEGPSVEQQPAFKTK